MTDEQRKKQRAGLVVMAGGVAAVAATGPVLLRNHPTWGPYWIGFVIVLLSVVIVQFSRVMRGNR